MSAENESGGPTIRFDLAISKFGDPISGKSELPDLKVAVAELAKCKFAFVESANSKYLSLCEGWMKRLQAQIEWYEASGSPNELERRKLATSLLREAIQDFDTNHEERLSLFCQEQRYKWLGVVSNHLSEFAQAVDYFGRGLLIAQNIDPGNVIWFEAAVAESNAWSKLNARLIEKDRKIRYGDISDGFKHAMVGYSDSGDTQMAAICEAWSLLTGFLEDPSFEGLPSVKNAYAKLGEKSVENVWKKGTPRRRLKADVFDRTNELGKALDDELRPVRLLEQAVNMAEELGLWLRSKLQGGGSLEVNIKVLAVSGLEIPPEIQWLVDFRSGRGGTKHGTMTREGWTAAYSAAQANEQRITSVLPNVIQSFKQQVEYRISGQTRPSSSSSS